MHHTSITAIVTVFSACAGLLHADIVRTDAFESGSFESFEDPTMVSFKQGETSALGGLAVLFSEGNGKSNRVEIIDGKFHIEPYDGERMLKSHKGTVGYQFSTGQHSFGGYFATQSKHDDFEIRFFAGEELLGREAFAEMTRAEWSWQGWASERAFDRVEIGSNHQRNGFLMHDAVRAMGVQIPAPGGVAMLIGGAFVVARRRR